MPIFLLGSRTRSVKIPDQTMSVSISGSVDNAMLYVVGSGGQQAVRVNRHVLIVPAATEGLAVGVEPHEHGTFDDDVVVHLNIGAEAPDEVDPVQIAFDPVNVSGSAATELATLTPHGGSVEVAVRSAPDTPLNALANMARTAARRSAGGHRVRQGGSLSIGIDTSASMRSAFGDGSVGAAIDVIVGVADAAGIRDVAATLIGARGTPIDVPSPELAKAVMKTPVRWSAGVRWSLLGPHGCAIAVTDFADTARASGFPTMCVSHDDAAMAHGPVLTTPPANTTAERHLVANTALVDQLVATLLPVLAGAERSGGYD